MRSIRRSLIVYFLLLMTAALGAVSWLAYQTTAQALHARQLDPQTLTRAQSQPGCDEARAALDRRLLRQAQTIASMARDVSLRYEPLYPLGALTAAPLPQSH